MRPNSYVIIFTPHAEPEIGIIQQRISPQIFVVTIGEVAVIVSRRHIERLKPRERRAYRKSRRSH